MNTVSVICPCGKPFDREVRRGRPQVWCPTCITIPFADRVRAEVVEGETVEAKPLNPNDPYSRNRDQIEAGVAEVNAAHKARFAALVAAGGDPWGAEAADLSAQLSDELRGVYAQFRKTTTAAVAEVEGDDD